jgi:8-oxo-dGTP diphosphatase
MVEQTLALIQREGPKKQVLLVRSKKTGVWNGPGGYVDQIALSSGTLTSEGLKDGVARETKEETGYVLNLYILDPVADIFFHFEGRLEHYVHVFRTFDFSGSPKPGGEISELRWFNIDDLPWNEMWAADKYWWPQLLVGKRIKDIPSIYYNKDGSALEREPVIVFE